MTCRIVRKTHTSAFFFLAPFLAAFLHSAAALAGNVDNWNVGTGNWSIAGNWTNGMPSPSTTAIEITNNDGINRTITYDYTGPALNLPQLQIDNTGGGTSTLSMPGNSLTLGPIDLGNVGKGAIIQNGGTFAASGTFGIGERLGSNGSYTLNGNSSTSFSANDGLAVGGNGVGTFTQTAGTASVSGNPLYIGSDTTGLGTYALSGGTLTVNNQNIYVGYQATGNANSSGGTFNQFGGSFSQQGGFLLIGNATGSTGTYNLGAGSMNIGAMGLGGNGTGTGTGTFNQTGGSITSGPIYLGAEAGATGTYIMSGSSTLTSSTVFVGYNGTGNFIQSAGNINPNTTDAQNSAMVVGYASGTTGTYTQTGGSNSVATLGLGNVTGSTGTYNLSGAATLSAGILDVASNGTGVFNQSGGSNSQNQIYVGHGTGSVGTYNLNGSSTLAANNLYVGYNGTGFFTQSGGANNSQQVAVGAAAGDTGTYTLSGGTLSSTSGIFVGGSSSGAGGTGILNVNGTGSLTTGALKIYNTPGSTVNFSGGSISLTSLNVSGTPSLFHWTGGTLSISNNLVFDPAASPTSTSAAFGPSLSLASGQTLAITGDETLGGSGAFALTVAAGGNDTVSGNLTVGSGSQLYLSGGTISTNSLAVSGGLFNWTSGTLNINGLQTITIGSGGLFGSAFTLGSGQTLNLYNSMTVNSGSLMTFNGGNFSAFSLINNGNVVMNSGTLTVSNLFNQASSLLVLGPGALATVGGGVSNGGEIQLGGDGATIFNTGGYTLTNTGLIHGDGTITLNLNNQSTGELRVESGNRIKFNGGGSNFGRIDVQNGTLEFTSPLGNASGGLIAGHGTLIFGNTGLTNNGNLAISGGVSDVFGDIHNSTGSASQGITISGNSNVTFWDDVTNGTSASDPTLFKVSSGSAATFFGTYSGNGVSGSGAVFYEADVSPGFSPASVNYGGNVTLDSAARLDIQLGGTTVGSQYDKLNVAGKLILGGILNVELYNGFSPVAGNKFDILDWGTLTGTFSSIVLPALSGSLEWNTSQLYSTGTLSIVNSSYLPGDFNRDGHVNAADILIAEQALANISSYKTAHGLTDPTLFNLVADVNGDGAFTTADVQYLLTALKNGGGSADPVPEPSTFGLAALAFGTLCWSFKLNVGQSQRRLVPVAMPITR